MADLDRDSQPPPLAVGLVGAGPWASMVHAPMLAAAPETQLAGVWARRPAAARELAERHGAIAVERYEDLLERCDAVAFAVPPDVQAVLAIEAARRGKHLLLEKPLALALEPAQELAVASEAAGVVTQLVLSYRYRAETESFLAAAKDFTATGARAAFLTSGSLEGVFATPWRREHGALYDLGPPALDLLEAALGPIADITGRGDSRQWVSLVCVHASGAVSDLALSAVVRIPAAFRCHLFGLQGTLEFDASTHDDVAPWARVRREFVAAVRAGRSHRFDVRHGLRLQQLIERAARTLG